MKAALLAELHRLGMSETERELEAWIDEPTAYAQAHEKRMIDKLVALGEEARKRRDVLSAAADYNRALAHAPGDPQLLRIVAGMSRAEARARLLRRAGKVLAATAVAGVLAFGIAKVVPFRRSPAGLQAVPPVAVPAAGASTGDVPPEPVVSAPPVTTTHPQTRMLPLTLGLRDAAPPRVVDRILTLDLKPPMGVSVSVDGQPPTEVASGAKVTVDSKAHALAFSCPRRGGDDPCVTTRVSIATGDKDDVLAVSVKVKDATLVVEGELGHTYQLVQHPEIALRVGVNAVALRSVYEAVTVQELETGKTVSLRLEAGKTLRAGF
jgi:serine/threonine-protein kinase